MVFRAGVLGLAAMVSVSMAQEAPDARPPGVETSFRSPRLSPVRAPESETSYMIRVPSTETQYGGGSSTAPAEDGLVRVALFADQGSTQKDSVDAIWKLLSEAEGISVEKVTTETVHSDSFFEAFDVFILPGGTASGQARAIGEEYGKRVAQEVRSGKGLVAICAGGYYVVEGWEPNTGALDLINAQNHDGKNWARGEQFIAVEVAGADDSESSRTIWYQNGPIFKPASIDGLPRYVSLVKYVTDLAAKDAPKGQMEGRDAVIAAPYGQGRVVAFGPHPELTPELNHWLINSVKWAAQNHGADAPINAETVLEAR